MRKTLIETVFITTCEEKQGHSFYRPYRPYRPVEIVQMGIKDLVQDRADNDWTLRSIAPVHTGLILVFAKKVRS